jgi:hypothetical protein
LLQTQPVEKINEDGDMISLYGSCVFYDRFAYDRSYRFAYDRFAYDRCAYGYGCGAYSHLLDLAYLAYLLDLAYLPMSLYSTMIQEIHGN